MRWRCSSSLECSLELRLQLQLELHRVAQHADVHSWSRFAIRRASPVSVRSTLGMFQMCHASVRAW